MKKLFCLAVILLAAKAQENPILKEFRQGNLQFSANAYKELTKENAGKNVLVSPLSASVILALTEAGAGGLTAHQLISGLSLPDSEEKIQEAFKSITPNLNVDNHYTLLSANKVYLKNGFTIKPQFKDVATKVFNADISEIDFTKNELAVSEINNWVLEKTHNKIKDLVTKDDLDDNTRAVLINALYFYGLWSKPFYEESTTEKPFKITNSRELKVKMMDQTSHFNYYEDKDLKAKFLEMYYDRSPVSMIFVLPNDIEGLPALESNIEKVLAVSDFKYEEVHVQIPHVNVEQKIDFVSLLQHLGVQDAFDSKLANFSRLNENGERVYISKIIQKTFIAVEEKGTTAAAATAVFAGVGSSFVLDPPPPKEFEANHPFIFILKSRTDGVLFIGRYVDPSS